MKRLLHIWKYPLALLLLLSFTGQVLATAASPCAMMQTAGEVSMSHASEMDHSMHNISQKSDHKAPASGCCKGACFCSMVHCLSLLALPASQWFLNPPTPDAPGMVSEQTFPIYSPESLYRPPILA